MHSIPQTQSGLLSGPSCTASSSGTLLEVLCAPPVVCSEYSFLVTICALLMNIHATRPADNVAVFIDIIVKAPIVQILSMLLGFGILALEYPAPFLKGTSLHRSLVVRIVVLMLQAFLAILYYQVRSDAPYQFIRF